MFGRKDCTLCGGRVVGGVCTECGLDNRKTRMYQEAEFLSEEQKDKMYQKNHTEANKKFFDDLNKEEMYSSENQRPYQGQRPHPGQRPPKKQSGVLKTIILIYVVIYIASILLNMFF